MNFSSALCVPQTHPYHSRSFDCSYDVWWGIYLVSAFLLGFYKINWIFIQIVQLSVTLHEGPSSINFKCWIEIKMSQAVSLISKGISVCFDRVLPERFLFEAVIIQNWNWLREYAAISEALCLFCKLFKALSNSEEFRGYIFFSGKYPHIVTNVSHIKQSNYVFNEFSSVILMQQTVTDNMHAVSSKVAHPFKIGPFLKKSLSCWSDGDL